MNKKHWKRLHRAFRVLSKDIYEEECPTKIREKHASLPESVKVHYYKPSGYELLFLFTIFKRHVNGGVDHEKARLVFRRCIRYNTQLGPHATVGRSHPCYWDRV